MAIKTISLELDAYEKLKRMKRGRESFSAVVRRAHFPPQPHTGAAILGALDAAEAEGRKLPKAVVDYWTDAEADDAAKPRISPSKWD